MPADVGWELEGAMRSVFLGLSPRNTLRIARGGPCSPSHVPSRPVRSPNPRSMNSAFSPNVPRPGRTPSCTAAS